MIPQPDKTSCAYWKLSYENDTPPKEKGKKVGHLECEGTWFWNGSYSTLNQTLILILTGRKWNSATIWTYSFFLVWVYLQVSNFEKSAEIIGTASYLDDLAGYNGIKITDKLSKLPLVNAVLTMCSASEDEGDVQQLSDSVPVESLVQDAGKMSQTSSGVIAPFSNIPSDATTK